jgi:hypothetical protein
MNEIRALANQHDGKFPPAPNSGRQAHGGDGPSIAAPDDGDDTATI